METGNFISNCLINTKNNVEPEVGMGITICMYSDRKVGTIQKFTNSKKTIWFTYDVAKRTDSNCMSDSQTYEYKENPDGYLDKITLRKDGVYRCSGTNYPVILNLKNAYYDYCF